MGGLVVPFSGVTVPGSPPQKPRRVVCRPAPMPFLHSPALPLVPIGAAVGVILAGLLVLRALRGRKAAGSDERVS